jgi:hypothetical protein
VGDVIAVHPYNGYTATAAILLSWDSGTSTVRLYRISGNVVRTYVGTLAGWAGVSTRPVVFLATVARVVFIVDEGKNEGLTCYDPNDVLGSGSALFQPTFDFNDDAAFVALKARLVIEHLNHLWVFGYGDEDSPDRYARCAYHLSRRGRRAPGRGFRASGRVYLRVRSPDMGLSTAGSQAWQLGESRNV